MKKPTDLSETHDPAMDRLLSQAILAVSREQFELIPPLFERFFEANSLVNNAYQNKQQYNGYQTEYHEPTQTGSTAEPKPIDPLGKGLLQDFIEISTSFLTTFIKAQTGILLSAMGPYVAYLATLLSLLSHIVSAQAERIHYQNGSPPGEPSLCLPIDEHCEEGFFADGNNVYARFKRTLVELTTNVNPSDLAHQTNCMSAARVADEINPNFMSSSETCTIAVNAAETHNIQPALFFSASQGAGPSQIVCENVSYVFQELAQACVSRETASTADIVLGATIGGSAILTPLIILFFWKYCRRPNQEAAVNNPIVPDAHEGEHEPLRAPDAPNPHYGAVAQDPSASDVEAGPPNLSNVSCHQSSLSQNRHTLHWGEGASSSQSPEKKSRSSPFGFGRGEG